MSHVPDPTEPSNSVLLELIEQLTDGLHKGDVERVEALLEQHPEHADRLRKILPVLQMVDSLDGSAANCTLSASRTDPLGNPGYSEPATISGTLGDFQILREVGRGGMGVVYEAEQISLNRRVALKVLPLAGMLDERQIQRFRNEARAAALLQHEHIVPIYGVGCERGVHYYAMQFIEAETLASVIGDLKQRQSSTSGESQSTEMQKSQGTAADVVTSPSARLSSDATSKKSLWREICRLVIHVAEALEHAHSMGVSHRDIKPSNLLLDKQAKIWIADFGLAQIDSVAGLTFTGDILGTLRYMSPEQARGDHRRIDHRTDIYSLGITLYELLALRPAFAEVDRRSLIRQVLEDEPQPLRQWDSRIPRDLETIVLKATQKLPEDRYQSIQLLADDLRALLSQQPILAKRPTLLDQMGKWSQRHRGALISTVGVLLLSVIGLLISTSLIMYERDAARTAEAGALEAAAEAEATKNRLAEQLYAADMRVAAEALQQGDTAEASALLARHAPTLGEVQRGTQRVVGLEWFFLNKRIGRPTILHSQTESVRGLVEVLGGGQLFFCGPNNMLCEFQTQTGELREVERVKTNLDSVLAVSADSRHLAVANSGGHIAMWDTSQWTPEWELQLGDKDVYDLLFSNDSSCLIVASKQPQVQVYDCKSGQLARSLDAHQDFVNDLSLSADGELLACCSYDERSSVWRSRTGELLHLTAPAGNRLTSVAISPHGDFWMDSTVKGAIRKTDIGSMQTALVAQLPSAIQHMAISPDGERLAVGCRSGILHVLDLKALFPVDRRPDEPDSAEVSQLSKSFLAHQKRIGKVAWFGTQSVISSGDDGKITMTRTQGEETLQAGSSSNFARISVSSSGRWIAGHDFQELQVTDTLSGHTFAVAKASVGSEWTGISFTPDENELLACTEDGMFHRFRLEDQTTILSGTAPSQANYGLLRFSSGGHRLLMFSDRTDQAVVVAYPSLEVLFRGSFPDASHGALSPDGRQLVSNFQRHLLLYDVESGELLRESRDHHAENITDLRFTPDGRQIVTTSDDRTIRVWDPQGDSAPSIVGVHPGGVPRCLSVSSDGRTLITSSRNGQVWAWSLPMMQKLMMFNGSPLGYQCFEISANDAILVTLDLPGNVHWIKMK